MKKVMLGLAVSIVALRFGFYYFSDTRQEHLAFEQHRTEWHQRCDAYVGKPVVSEEAKDCARELSAMMAYKKEKGW
jgi:hypothetical protein